MQNVLCPAPRDEIVTKLGRLRSIALLRGARGKRTGDVEGLLELIERVAWLMAAVPELEELDLNPVRVPEDGSAVQVLDVRLRIKSPTTNRPAPVPSAIRS